MPFDFRAVTAPFRMQPGLRRLAEAAPALTACSPGGRTLQEKLAVLRDHPERALLALPGYDDRALLSTLSELGCRDAPDALAWDGAQSWHARALGWEVRGAEIRGDGPPAIGRCLRALPERWRAVALLALAFEEDWAAIDGRSAKVPWLAVCLPSHWAPEDKLGLHFAQVHAPVADGDRLRAAAAHLAALVSGSQRWERFVWTVTPHPDLNLHPKTAPAPGWRIGASVLETVAQAWWRTEHQRFVPTGAGQALFIIHVDSRPLVQAIDCDASAARLHAALHSMSPAVLDYRGLTAARPALLAWLERWPSRASTAESL